MDDETCFFSWNEIPGKDENRFKEFLKHYFCVSWIDTLQFVKSSDGGTISISDKSQSLSINLNDEKTRAILTIDGCETCKFIVKDGKLKYCECFDLVKHIQCTEQILRKYLDDLKKKSFWIKLLEWRFPEEDPVRIKNMEKIIGHLQGILLFFDSPNNTACERTASLSSLLNQIKEPEKISFNNAWELADLFEIELIRHGDDAYLYMLLSSRDTAHKWDNHFPGDYLKTLLESYHKGKYLFSWDKIPGNDKGRFIEFLKNNFCVDWVETAKVEKIDDKTIRVSTEKNSLSLRLNDERTRVSLEIVGCRTGKFIAEMENSILNIYDYGVNFPDRYRLEARRFLEYLLQAQVSEFRRDRAKVALRGKILVPMALSLAILLFGFSLFYYFKTKDLNLLIVLFSGAIGSVLSRSIKLINQPLRGETDSKTGEPPLGIRSMMSESKIFFAQPFIGATAALILFLVFSAGQVQLAVNEASKPAAYGIIAFLAGYSEVYFIGILDKAAGQTGSSLR